SAVRNAGLDPGGLRTNDRLITGNAVRRCDVNRPPGRLRRPLLTLSTTGATKAAAARPTASKTATTARPLQRPTLEKLPDLGAKLGRRFLATLTHFTHPPH